MRKILLSVVVVVVVLAGYSAYTVFHSKSKVDAFFHLNEGNLYNRSGITWKLTGSEVGTFGGKYTTELSVYGYHVATVEHEAVFGVRGLNIFNLGTITSTATIEEIAEFAQVSGKKFVINSDIGFSGLQTNFFTKENSKSLDEEKIPVTLSWKDIKVSTYVSFERDVLDYEADIPYFSASSNGTYDTFSVVIENQKYSSSMSDKKVGFWLGDSSFKIGKIQFITKEAQIEYSGDEDEEDTEELKVSGFYDSVVTLSGLDVYSDVKDEAASTLASNTKVKLDTLSIEGNVAGEENKTIENIVLNLNLENLDLESLKKIYNSLSNIDPLDKQAMMFVAFEWATYVPDILGKQPKIVLKELSGKYKGKTSKISGLVQYIGKGNVATLATAWQKDITGKLDFEISDEIVKKILKDQLPSWNYNTDEELEKAVEGKLKGLEESLGIKVQDGTIKGSFEYKDAKPTLNGKDIAKNAILPF
jgi:uncharacterized protein YdgA (DUF945 family)